MSELKYWQEKIKEKRKNTSFREFLKEIASWRPLVFYKNNNIVSLYPDTQRIPKIIHHNKFEDIRQDLPNLEYNFSKDFFENFDKLLKKTPVTNIAYYGNNENAEYADQISNTKNIYLSYIILGGSQNVLYSLYVKGYSKNIISSLWICRNSENIYFSSGILQSFNTFFSKNIINSNNIWFSSDLIGCTECVFSNKLKNKSYYIKNTKYSKDKYFRKKEEILKKNHLFYSYYNKLSSSGIFPLSSFNKNTSNTFFVENVKNGNNLFFAGGSEEHENMYDCFAIGTKNDFYGCISAGGDSQNLFCGVGINGYNLFYSYFLEGCSFCIGCIGLKNKSYCILNKQYTKKEWNILANKIFSQMEENGILGDFFPGKLNPFYFNDTMAGLIGDFTKEEVVKEGYMWRDEEIKVDIPDENLVISVSDLDKYEGFNKNGDWQINPKILKKVIKDKKGNYYKIVKIEYDFLVKHNLPLPKIHWMDRIKVNFGI